LNLLDHPIISQRYFFPRPTPVLDPVMVPVDGAELACWRGGAPTDDGQPLLVFFHGNGEVVADWVPFWGPFCASLGYGAFLAEYRGYGASTGVPALGAMLGDVDAIAAATGVDPARIVVVGRSVGSIYAIEWVRRFPKTRGLIIESGIHDVLERLALRMRPAELGVSRQEMTEAVAAQLDHQAKLEGYAGPSLFMHALGDDLVTPDNARANAAAAQDAQLVLFDRGDHNSIQAANGNAYLTALSDFLVPLKPL
jgi:pimeloyl-ACP methyl ester carboxylesterase